MYGLGVALAGHHHVQPSERVRHRVPVAVFLRDAHRLFHCRGRSAVLPKLAEKKK